MIARDDRLRSETDFERVRARGRSWTSRAIVLSVLSNDLGRNRYGFAAGRRLGNAVRRNRAKRLLREAVRAAHPRLEQGYDLIFIARNAFSEEMTLADVSGDVLGLLTRARLLRGGTAE